MRRVVRLLNMKQFADALDSAEKEIYLAAYKHAGWNQAETARLLGISRGTVIRKLKYWATVK